VKSVTKRGALLALLTLAILACLLLVNCPRWKEPIVNTVTDGALSPELKGVQDVAPTSQRAESVGASKSQASGLVVTAVDRKLRTPVHGASIFVFPVGDQRARSLDIGGLSAVGLTDAHGQAVVLIGAMGSYVCAATDSMFGYKIVTQASNGVVLPVEIEMQQDIKIIVRAVSEDRFAVIGLSVMLALVNPQGDIGHVYSSAITNAVGEATFHNVQRFALSPRQRENSLAMRACIIGAGFRAMAEAIPLPIDASTTVSITIPLLATLRVAVHSVVECEPGSSTIELREHSTQEAWLGQVMRIPMHKALDKKSWVATAMVALGKRWDARCFCGTISGYVLNVDGPRNFGDVADVTIILDQNVVEIVIPKHDSLVAPWFWLSAAGSDVWSGGAGLRVQGEWSIVVPKSIAKPGEYLTMRLVDPEVAICGVAPVRWDESTSRVLDMTYYQAHCAVVIVKSEDGSPIEGCGIHARTGSDGGKARVKRLGDGRYRIASTEPLSKTFSISHGRFETSDVQVNGDTSDVVLRMARRGTIRLLNAQVLDLTGMTCVLSTDGQSGKQSPIVAKVLGNDIVLEFAHIQKQDLHLRIDKGGATIFDNWIRFEQHDGRYDSVVRW